MVYDWSGDKREICFQKYIIERLPLDELMKYFKETQNFVPSKRAFQTQFRRWEFPTKQSPAHKNEDLANRVRELWEENCTQLEMLQILRSEGYEIKERELSRLRKKRGLQMRAAKANPTDIVPLKRDRLQMESIVEKTDPLVALDDASKNQKSDKSDSIKPPIISPDSAEKRQKYLEKLQAESDKRFHNHTRRRRTRPWAGLPADPAGPPRFPSETTIDESKQILGLDDTAYVSVREQFQAICEQGNIRKKTEAGTEQWQNAKMRLAAENQHLRSVFFTNELVDHAQHKLALDVICSDVTKRIRTMNARLTIQECKNILKVNPEEARTLRKSFEKILLADRFTSKLEAGPEHWNELKSLWLRQSHHLQQLLKDGETDPQHGLKVKAMELMCRDVMKRLKDDQTRRNARRKQNNSDAEMSKDAGAAASRSNDVRLAAEALAAAPSSSSQGPAPSHLAPSQAQCHTVPAPILPLAGIADYADLQIDPKLLLAASDPNVNIAPIKRNSNFMLTQKSNYDGNQESLSEIEPQPIYFRLSPKSPIQQEPKVWLASLVGMPSVDVLRTLALTSHGCLSLQNSMSAVKIEGLVLTSVNGWGAAGGAEMCFPIDEDDELLAYLQHVKGGKATFLVHFV